MHLVLNRNSVFGIRICELKRRLRIVQSQSLCGPSVIRIVQLARLLFNKKKIEESRLTQAHHLVQDFDQPPFTIIDRKDVCAYVIQHVASKFAQS